MANAAARPGQEQRPPRSVRRVGHLMMSLRRLRVEPGLRPGLIGSLTAEFDAVVQTERAVVPELEAQGRDAPAAPPLRARHLADEILGRELRDRLFKREAALQRF